MISEPLHYRSLFCTQEKVSNGLCCEMKHFEETASIRDFGVPPPDTKWMRPKQPARTSSLKVNIRPKNKLETHLQWLRREIIEADNNPLRCEIVGELPGEYTHDWERRPCMLIPENRTCSYWAYLAKLRDTQLRRVRDRGEVSSVRPDQSGALENK
ncbi:hypothetical protein AG1IA_07556 [Rhizoctonia solani AG-1 IA]|uniref:Uncharacterized protein n=1 Tax=Thanatephorus cucumeris (strain AG1-IA) TaxID=983506 RepID=L8WQ03_THACA|nr:hypothetical protein AG1IA_07556 [Rhizoctonia solani AG-1 IA]